MKINKSVLILKLLGGMGLMSGALALSSCVDPYINEGRPVGQQNNPIPGGGAFKQALERSIARADKIVIEEHSDKSDFAGTLSDSSSAPRYVYGTHQMSAAEKDALLNDVRRLNPQLRTDYSNCVMKPHYTIDFYEQGWLSSKLKVSYDCQNVSWNGSNATVPANILSAVAPAIQRAGFTNSKNWKAAAASRYTPPESNSNSSTGTKPTKPKGPPTAKKIPGKKGHVYNPFNQNEVDVEGIPSGTKVRDPHDPNADHIFRVP